MKQWFSHPYAEQIRVAQSAAMARRLPFALIGSFLASLASVLHMGLRGVDWQAFIPPIVLIWLLLVPMLFRWLELRRHPAAAVTSRQATLRTAHAGLLGIAWAILQFTCIPALPYSSSVQMVAAAIGQTAGAVAAFSVAPMAALAFCIPIWVASTISLGSITAKGSGFYLVISYIALLAVGFLWLLRENWRQFLELATLASQNTRLVRELRQQKETAEMAVLAKSRFLAAASHDLRQPMHAISLYLGALSETELPAAEKKVVADARTCAHNMNDMFRALLDISRLDTQRAEPELSVFSISGLLCRLQAESAPLAAQKGLHFRVKPCSALVRSDPRMVERILNNFVSNAVRYTESGGVLVSCRQKGSYLRVCVYDTGNGIAPADQHAIFDEFHRLDANRDDRTGGLGLGLAIVQRLAHSLKAKVTVRSAPGAGSLFAVDLPLAIGEVATAEPEAPAPIEVADDYSDVLVVVIDDEAAILSAVTCYLERAGCSVIAAASGDEALARLSALDRPPSAIICDYELRDGKKGTQAVEAIREEFNSDIPALLITGDTGSGLPEEQGRRLGVQVLYKPVEAEALWRSLASLLRVSI